MKNTYLKTFMLKLLQNSSIAQQFANYIVIDNAYAVLYFNPQRL